MRYYDLATHTETDIESETTIPETDSRVAKFFAPAIDGELMIIGNDGFPYWYLESEGIANPIVVGGDVVEDPSPPAQTSYPSPSATDTSIIDVGAAPDELINASGAVSMDVLLSSSQAPIGSIAILSLEMEVSTGSAESYQQTTISRYDEISEGVFEVGDSICIRKVNEDGLIKDHIIIPITNELDRRLKVDVIDGTATGGTPGPGTTLRYVTTIRVGGV